MCNNTFYFKYSVENGFIVTLLFCMFQNGYYGNMKAHHM